MAEKTPQIVPLTAVELDLEIGAIRQVFDILQPLDHAPRTRVVEWLRNWISYEEPYPESEF